MRNLEGPAVILFDTRKRKENTQKMLCVVVVRDGQRKKKKTIGITPVGDISSSSMGGGRLSKY
jgi:hypothetical protein